MTPATLRSASPPVLRSVGLTFGRNGRALFRNVSLSIPPGTCTAVIGPNGVGKTTFLRVMAGSLRAQAGEVLLAGRNIASLTPREIATEIALVPQQLDIPFDFTVEEIVRLGRHPFRAWMGGLRAIDQIAVMRALAATHATELRTRKFNELSGGEKQRVKIALGLAQEPRLLLLDEPGQNLDIGRQLEMVDLIRSLSRSGVTIISATHDLSLIQGTYSSVVLLCPGGEVLQGTPAQILQPHILEHAFRCPPQAEPGLSRQRSATWSAIV